MVVNVLSVSLATGASQTANAVSVMAMQTLVIHIVVLVTLAVITPLDQIVLCKYIFVS